MKSTAGTPFKGKKFSPRIPKEELLSKTTEYLKEKGVDHHFKAVMAYKALQEVHASNDPIFGPMIASPKVRDAQAWKLAQAMIVKFLDDFKMETTIEAISSEDENNSIDLSVNIAGLPTFEEMLSKAKISKPFAARVKELGIEPKTVSEEAKPAPSTAISSSISTKPAQKPIQPYQKQEPITQTKQAQVSQPKIEIKEVAPLEKAAPLKTIPPTIAETKPAATIIKQADQPKKAAEPIHQIEEGPDDINVSLSAPIDEDEEEEFEEEEEKVPSDIFLDEGFDDMNSDSAKQKPHQNSEDEEPTKKVPAKAPTREAAVPAKAPVKEASPIKPSEDEKSEGIDIDINDLSDDKEDEKDKQMLPKVNEAEKAKPKEEKSDDFLDIDIEIPSDDEK